MPEVTRQSLFLALLVATCIYAAARGGKPERIAAATYLAGSLLSVSAANEADKLFRGPEFGILAVDLLMVMVFTWLALVSTRFWPMWVCAVIWDETIVHAVRTLAPQVIPAAYLDAQAIWGWMAMLLLIAGIWRHSARRRTGTADPAWKI